MKGNALQKLLRLAGYLAAHPGETGKYLSQSLGKKSPLELGLPWISFDAIEFLTDYVQKEHTVAEFGGGGSSLFFARRAKQVLCIESDGQWADSIRAAIEREGLANFTLDLLPFDPNNPASYEESAHLHRLDGEMFDIILVDGYEEDELLRPICFRHAEKHINQGGIIIVDDSWRYPQLCEQNNAKRRQRYQSIGPCRPGVTTTDIYFY